MGTAVADRIAQSADSQIRISRLIAIDLPSVFAIKVRTKFISREDSQVLWRQFREDIASGKFEVFGLRESELAGAERLIEQYAFDVRLRALDAIQVAVALALKAQSRIAKVAKSKSELIGPKKIMKRRISAVSQRAGRCSCSSSTLSVGIVISLMS